MKNLWRMVKKILRRKPQIDPDAWQVGKTVYLDHNEAKITVLNYNEARIIGENIK